MAQEDFFGKILDIVCQFAPYVFIVLMLVFSTEHALDFEKGVLVYITALSAIVLFGFNRVVRRLDK